MSKKTWNLVTDGVYLYSSKQSSDGRISILYEVECAVCKNLHFELDLTQSQNFSFPESSGGKLQVVVGPYQRVRVGVAVSGDQSKRSVLKVQYKWKLADAPAPDAHKQLEIDAQDSYIANQIRKFLSLGLDYAHDPIALIENKCLENSLLFVDPEFPPLSSTLRPRGDDLAILWKRPSDFMSGPFDVFASGIEPADIRQGALCDCWLQCTLAGLAEFPELIEKLFIQSLNLSRVGVYRVRLCKNGVWQDITVDDYFPCFTNGGGPVYSRNHDNEIWVMLVEKAFAKSFGSYSAMRHGWCYEAMIDLTGAPYKTIRLQDEDVVEDASKGMLWSELLHYDESGCIISAVTPGEDVCSESGDSSSSRSGTAGRSNGPNGLISGHAYTILQVVETRQDRHRLLKLRNPWGRFEWTGDWSDNSDLWTPLLRHELDAENIIDDGTFWMSFQDVCRYFYSINVCMATHKGSHSPLFERRRRTFFVFGNERSDRSNLIVPPMYVLTVSETSKVYLSLHQQDSRDAAAPPYVDIGLTLLKLKPDFTFDLVSSTGTCVERQVQCDATLTAGHYIVVALTSGCKYSQYCSELGNPYYQEIVGEGTGRACDLSSTTLTLLDSTTTPQLSESAAAAFREIFSRLDEDIDGVLNFDELDRYLQLTENCPLEQKIFVWMLRQFHSKNGGLTVEGFLQAQLYMCLSSGSDQRVLMNDLQFMGYSRDMKLKRVKPVVLVVHSEKDCILRSQPFDRAAYYEAIELPIKRLGVCKEYESGKILVYTYKCGYTGVSVAVENKSETDALSFEMDCSNCRNCVSSRNTMVTVDVVTAGSFCILHHLMMRDVGDWSWSFEASYKWLV